MRKFRCEVFPVDTELDAEVDEDIVVVERWHWRLIARNGVIVAGSVQGPGYRDKRSAEAMFEKIIDLRHTDVEIVEVDQ
jgi:hypothetical protein